MCEAYPLYSVEVSGVGEPPAESRHVGHCSQMATFSRTGMMHYVRYTGMMHYVHYAGMMHYVHYTVTSCYNVGIAEIARKRSWPFVIYTDCCGGFMYTEISLFAPQTSFPVSVQEASSTELRVALLISL